MGGQKAIELTTQAMASAATEVKGVEQGGQKIEEDSSKNTVKENPSNLRGSDIFNKK